MKKLMFSLCALCLVGAASAQVSTTPVNGKAQRFTNSSVAAEFENSDVQTVPARKDGEIEYVEVQSAYGWDRKAYNLAWFAIDQSQNDLGTKGFCNEDHIFWTYGTGGLPTMGGTGEIGYRFFSGSKSYYNRVGIYPNYGVPYAAGAYIVRVPSVGLLHRDEDGNEYYDPMPFYFKLYDYTKVGEQKVRASITQNGPTDETVDVVYPTDPEKYTALTDTAWIYAGCTYVEEDKKMHPNDTFVRREFLNIDKSKRLGDNFCVSMMFPVEWDEEGDSVIDPRWNAMPLCMLNNTSGLISEEPHSVYFVVDYERDMMWWDADGKHLGKRPSGLVEDSLMQPNDRYAIFPFDSYYMKYQNGNIDNSTDEFWMNIYYTEWSALQSANKADRYVQLSPVPAVDYVNFKSYTDMSRIEIYSLGGQLVKAVNVSGDTYRLDLTGMNSGMYVARIYSEKGISSKKLIVR
ncbi:T9SS type A sorting domain-containing protein [bacterium]|nr:T9SS type A sorting domain-containing protein [bacterium]